MPTIVDYASLTTAITDFAHRTDISGTSAFTDYFIQGAIEQIQNDIFDLNFGNGIQFQENSYPVTAINGTTGTIPVPSDWLAPKVMTVSDGSSDFFTLVFKSAAWIYDNYPIRQPFGLPQYIARDVQAGGSFPTATAFQKFTTTANQTAFTLNSSLPPLLVAMDGAVFVPSVDYNISGTALTLTSGALANQTLLVQYGAMTAALTASATSAFIFGPYPDAAYNVQGTYYQNAPMLSNSTTTNWMVLNFPTGLHAACMVRCGEFLKDAGMLAQWTPIYEKRLQALVDRDKAERWSASTMQIELG